VLIAARNSEIEQRLALLKRAEVDPVALDLDSAALANAFALSSSYDETKNTLLVDMGATSTKIVLLEQGKLKKIRSLRTGSTVLDPARMIPEPLAVDASGELRGGGVAGERSGEAALESRFREFENALRELDLGAGAGDRFVSGSDDLGALESRADAPIAILSDDDYLAVQYAESAEATPAADVEIEAARPVAGEDGESPEHGASRTDATAALAAGVAVENDPAGEAPTDESLDYRAYLDRVGVEIQRTLATTQLDAPIELICLTGGMGRREEARRYFQEAFDIDAVRLDFRGSVQTDLDPAQLDLASAEGAVAVGLAAKGLGMDLVGLDFRKGPYRYEHRLERVRIPLLVASILCFAVFLQTAVWSYHRFRYVGEHAGAYEAEAARAYKTFFDKDLAPNRNALVAAQKEKQDWEAGGLSNVGRFLPFVDVVRDVGKVMAEASKDTYFELSSIRFNFGLSRTVKGQGKTKKEEWRSAGDSQLMLDANGSNFHLDVESAFNRSPGSEFFEAETTSSPQPDGTYRVTVKLKVAEKVLKAPASGSPP
jgi:hypothetical protein